MKKASRLGTKLVKGSYILGIACVFLFLVGMISNTTAIPTANIIIDGNFNNWSGVTIFLSNPADPYLPSSLNIKNVYIAENNSDYFFRWELYDNFSFTNSFPVISFDAGSSFILTDNLDGPKEFYNISNAVYNQYVPMINISTNQQFAVGGVNGEMSIPISEIPNASISNLDFSVFEEMGQTVICNAPLSSEPPSFTIDGNNSDWDSVPLAVNTTTGNFSTPSFDILDAKVAYDSNNLYAFIHTLGVGSSKIELMMFFNSNTSSNSYFFDYANGRVFYLYINSTTYCYMPQVGPVFANGTNGIELVLPIANAFPGVPINTVNLTQIFLRSGDTVLQNSSQTPFNNYSMTTTTTSTTATNSSNSSTTASNPPTTSSSTSTNASTSTGTSTSPFNLISGMPSGLLISISITVISFEILHLYRKKKEFL